MNKFERIRKDHQNETAEDYVELIFQLIERNGSARVKDLAANLGVSSVTVSKTIKRLIRDNYVTCEPYKEIYLTEKGIKLAKNSIARHDIVYKFLVSIGVPMDIAEIDAEGIEHHISSTTLDKMKKMID